MKMYGPACYRDRMNHAEKPGMLPAQRALRLPEAVRNQVLAAMPQWGADYAKTDGLGRSVIHTAAANGDVSAIQFLVDRCGWQTGGLAALKLNQQTARMGDYCDVSPMAMAIMNKKWKAVELLKSNGVNFYADCCRLGNKDGKKINAHELVDQLRKTNRLSPADDIEIGDLLYSECLDMNQRRFWKPGDAPPGLDPTYLK
ncbi:MAG: hypothetical protein JWP52_390, partial [Rhizobacter sp.]|nr:hypothetical protein [Rhizobacter sp.]